MSATKMPVYCKRINKLNRKTQRTELNMSHRQGYPFAIIGHASAGMVIAISLITGNKRKKYAVQNTRKECNEHSREL
ncbi:MAG: hypothetical protein ACLPP9_00265 [Smithella sp.]